MDEVKSMDEVAGACLLYMVIVSYSRQETHFVFLVIASGLCQRSECFLGPLQHFSMVVFTNFSSVILLLSTTHVSYDLTPKLASVTLKSLWAC